MQINLLYRLSSSHFSTNAISSSLALTKSHFFPIYIHSKCICKYSWLMATSVMSSFFSSSLQWLLFPPASNTNYLSSLSYPHPTYLLHTTERLFCSVNDANLLSTRLKKNSTKVFDEVISQAIYYALEELPADIWKTTAMCSKSSLKLYSAVRPTKSFMFA